MTEIIIETEVQIAASEKFTDPVHIISTDTPVSIIMWSVQVHAVCISIEQST